MAGGHDFPLYFTHKWLHLEESRLVLSSEYKKDVGKLEGLVKDKKSD